MVMKTQTPDCYSMLPMLPLAIKQLSLSHPMYSFWHRLRMSEPSILLFSNTDSGDIYRFISVDKVITEELISSPPVLFSCCFSKACQIRAFLSSGICLSRNNVVETQTNKCVCRPFGDKIADNVDDARYNLFTNVKFGEDYLPTNQDTLQLHLKWANSVSFI